MVPVLWIYPISLSLDPDQLNSNPYYFFYKLFWLQCSSLQLLRVIWKRRSKTHSGEYDWLGPGITQNTQGLLYHYIFSSFNYSDPVWYLSIHPKCGITFSLYCTEVIKVYIYSVSQCQSQTSLLSSLAT